MIEDNNDIKRRFSEITDRWFVREPLMLLILLSHKIVSNLKIKYFRSGQGRIEYNPDFIKTLTKEQLEERLKVEVIRILLLHPYRHHNNKAIAYLASNITLNEFYQFNELEPRAKDIWPNSSKDYFHQNFEFYLKELIQLQTNSSFNTNSNDSDNQVNYDKLAKIFPVSSAEETELWEDDAYQTEKIKEVIENIANDSSQWGSIPHYLKETIIANLRPQVDYRKIIRSFNASIISSQHVLTRFKPSRRYGWLYMGRKSDFTTHLLIAIDVSGSILNKDLQNFYSIINRFFKYGIKQISVIQFDTEIKGEPLIFQKAKKEIKVLGRGGTDFQPPIDYYLKNNKSYDGLLVFTDGYAYPPKFPKQFRNKILFLYNNKRNYEYNKERMEEVAKMAWIENSFD